MDSSMGLRAACYLLWLSGGAALNVANSSAAWRESFVVPGTSGCGLNAKEQHLIDGLMPKRVAAQAKKDTAWFADWAQGQKAHLMELKKTKIGRVQLAAKAVKHSFVWKDVEQAGGEFDKYLYFFLHEDAECSLDGGLTTLGKARAKALVARHHSGTSQLQKVEAVITSPMQRCMQTAILAFNNTRVTIEPDLMEIGGIVVFTEGEKALRKAGREDLIKSYDRIWGNKTTTEFYGAGSDAPPNRWNKFLHKIFNRTERHIAIFGDRNLFQIGLDEDVGRGEVVVRTLKGKTLFKPRRRRESPVF